MANRPDIELALDVRTYEHVVVLADPQSEYSYPEHWVRPTKGGDLDLIDPESIVVIDRIEIFRRTVAAIGAKQPRLLAFAPVSQDQDKLMRRTIRSVYPWATFWEIQTSFGRLLVTSGVRGTPYDRDQLIDMRPVAGA